MKSNYKTDASEVVTVSAKARINYDDSWQVEGLHKAKMRPSPYAADIPTSFDVDPLHPLFHKVRFRNKSLAQSLASASRLLSGITVARYSHYAPKHLISEKERPDYERYIIAALQSGLARCIAEKCDAVDIRVETEKDVALAREDMNALGYLDEQVQITAECIVIKREHYDALCETVRELNAIVAAIK